MISQFERENQKVKISVDTITIFYLVWRFIYLPIPLIEIIFLGVAFKKVVCNKRSVSLCNL